MSTRAKRTAGGEEKPTSTTPSKRGRGAKDTEGYLLFKEEEKSKNKKEKVSDIKSRWEGMSEDMKKEYEEKAKKDSGVMEKESTDMGGMDKGEMEGGTMKGADEDPVEGVKPNETAPVGVNVEFPKTPYECQVTYMQKVLQAMSTGSNALLESPTGTGKTLSLLCASLAWQKQHNRRLEPANDKINQFDQFNVSKDNSTANAPTINQNVVIIYATRTHSQLNQVIRELQSTAYRPKMAVLGSREQLCIHDKVSKLKGSAINHACTTLTTQRGCRYRNNLDSDNGSVIHVSQEEVVDIEDLALIGRRKAICPYFYSRDMSANADIIFMPYNYLLDASIRKTTRIPFQNAVVIFDEAHNLEQVSSDAASCTLTSADIAACIKELQQVLATLQNDISRSKEDRNSSNNGKSDGSALLSRPDLHLTMQVLRACFALEQQLDGVQLSKHEATNTMCAVLPGKWLVDLLMGVGFQTDQHIDTIRKCGAFLVDAAEEALGGGMSGPSGYAPEPKLAAFYTALERILHTGRQEHQDFQVYIADEENKKNKNGNITTYYHDASTRSATRRVVNFMCFSTGVALKELTKLGVRSLILTSGTLSPMEAMKEDLKLPFVVELQNPHVIKTNQIWVGALGKGPKNITLTSSFANRSNVESKDELGITILEIACSLLGTPSSNRTALSSSLAPTVSCADMPKIKGGVLVFFPAYHILENTIERWQFSGLYQHLVSAAGAVIVETRANTIKKAEGSGGSNGAFGTGYGGSSGSFGATSESGRPAKQLDDNNEEEQQEAVLSNLVKQFERTIASKGSCILLAVCRGKVAEGVDFSDNKGRVVIVTGIPFAPFMDPWVALKKAYLDRKTMVNALTPILVNNAAPGGPVTVANLENNLWASAAANAPAVKPNSGQEAGYQAGPKGTAIKHLTGQMWYNQSAARAVNQCLGRVIRHQNDWGAIFLLDDRFLADRQLYQISKWMRPMVKKYFTAKDALTNFRAFLGHIAQDDSLHPAITTPSAPIQDKPVSKAPPKAEQRAQPNPFSRFVEISESELPSSTQEPACFIQQQLLASQQQPRRAVKPFSTSGDDDYNSLIQFTQPRMQQCSSQMDIISSQSDKDRGRPPMDLRAKLALLKTKESQTAPASKVLINQPFGKPSGSTDLLFSQISDNRQIIDLFSEDKADDDGDEGFGLSTSSSVPLSQAVPSSQSQLAAPSDESKPKLSSSILSQAFKTAKTNAAQGGASKLIAGDRNATEGYILEILSQLKNKVSTEEIAQLKGLFTKVKRQGGLQNLSQVKEFQEDFVNIVNLALTLEEQTNVLRAMKVLVDSQSSSSSSLIDNLDKLRDIYLQLVNQRYERLLKKRRFEAAEIKQEQLPALSSTALPTSASIPVSLNSKVGSDTGSGGLQLNSGVQKEAKTSQLAFGSSRAQYMLQRVQGASVAAAAARNPSMMAKIEQISDFSMGSQLKPSGSGVTGPSSGQYISATSKLQCCVCKETAEKPCAAKCGHICCQECWTRCLQIKPMCPYCRAPTTKDSISKLLVRASTS